MAMVEAVLEGISVYGAVGAAFALFFVFLGLGRVDPHAKEASFGFRLMIIPGVILLWPLVLWRVLVGRREQ